MGGVTKASARVIRDPKGFASRAMPLHKKITAVVVFALCGFLGGFISQAQAITSVSVSGGYLSVDSSSIPTQRFYFMNSGTFSSVDRATALSKLVNCTDTSCAGFTSGNGYSVPYTFPGFSGASSYLGGTTGYYAFALDVDGSPFDITTAPVKGTFYYNGSVPSSVVLDSGGTPSDPSVSSITSTSPVGTISSSSPLTIVIGADIHAADVASSTANGGLLRIFSWVGGVDTAFVSPSHAWTVTAGGATTTSYQVTTDLPAGNFKIYASIYALDQYGAFGPTYSATTTFFTLNSSYFEHLTGTSTPANLGYKNAPCGISDLSGCFQNAIAFLFYPSVSPGQAVSTVSSAAQGKFPFVYVYQLGAIRTSLLTASSTAPTGLTVNLWKLPNTATSTIELISATKVAAVPFSGTIYTVLTWLIWLGMAEYIYYRVIRMHDVNTPPT